MHSGCRIRSVTHKASGFKVIRMMTGPERTRSAIIREATSMFDAMISDGRPVVGMALVLWDGDGGSAAALKAYPGSLIPSIAMPEFVRNRLLAAKIEEWVHT